MSEALAIRPHDPRVTRAAVLALALVAGGSFAYGMAKQVAVRPLGYGPTEAAQPTAIDAAVALPAAAPAPSMQVATTEPAAPRPKAAPAPKPKPAPIVDAPALAIPPLEPAAPAPDAAAIVPTAQALTPITPEPARTAEAPSR